MSPTKLPTAPRKSWTASRRSLLRNPLGAAAAISFSLTFVGAGIALLLGYLPAGTVIGASEVDTGVVLLFVPLCALILAILVEVVRASLRDGISSAGPRQPNRLAAWKPGHGEG